MSAKKERLTREDFSDIDIGKGVSELENNNIGNHVEIDTNYFALFSVVWHGDIKLEVLNFYGAYRIVLTKGDTFLESHVFHNADGVVRRVTRLAELIKTGQFDKKKTTRERVQQIIEQRGLTSYMNHTKWEKFLYAMEHELPFVPPYEFKTLFEDEDSEVVMNWKNWRDWEIPYTGNFDDEDFPRNQLYSIEWVRLIPRLRKNLGGLLVQVPEIADETEEIQEVLEKYHIPYEMQDGYFIVYGYK